jgi:hypothetical protein
MHFSSGMGYEATSFKLCQPTGGRIVSISGWAPSRDIVMPHAIIEVDDTRLTYAIMHRSAI